MHATLRHRPAFRRPPPRDRAPRAAPGLVLRSSFPRTANRCASARASAPRRSARTADIGPAATTTSLDRPLKLHVESATRALDATVVRHASADVDGHARPTRCDRSRSPPTPPQMQTAAASRDGYQCAALRRLVRRRDRTESGPATSLRSTAAARIGSRSPSRRRSRRAWRACISPRARGTLEGGTFAIEELKWEEGRLSSRGDFSHLPAAPLLALAAARIKDLASTLTLSGRWDFAAKPRVTGTLSISRDDGDLAPIDAPGLALGLTRLDLAAVSTDDHVHATLAARSRLGDADVEADLGASPHGAGRFDSSAPLSLKAHVDSRVAARAAIARRAPTPWSTAD